MNETTRGLSLENLLRDPFEQFDARGELLASIVTYAAAKPDAASTFTAAPPLLDPMYLWLDAPTVTTAA